MLDVIHGLVLLGILLVNSQTYSLFAWLSPNQVYQAQLDRPEIYVPVRFFIYFLVQGPLYPLSNFLFGLGFYRFWQILQQKGLDANRIVLRGLCALFVLGILHSIGFWFGDVLHQHAMLGFTLFYFMKQSTKIVLLSTAGLLGLIILISLFQTMPFSMAIPPAITDSSRPDPVHMKILKVWQQGSLIEVMQGQANAVQMRYLNIFKQALAPLLNQELLMLLGLAVGKSGVLGHMDRLRLQLSLLMLVIFPIAALLNGLNALLALGLFIWPADWPGDQVLILSLTAILGTPLLALIYGLEICFHIKRYSKGWTIWVGQAGQMGLTNYLLQTLLCMLCFYGYGLGLAGRLSLLESLIPVAIIYAFQLIFSHWWLSHYQQGPLEWIWRWLANGKRTKNGPLKGST